MGGISGGHIPPVAHDKAMVFIDGTNVLLTARDHNLLIPNFYALGQRAVAPRQLIRVYVYSIEEQINTAKALHGSACFEKCRVVLGDSIQTPKGGVREKGVDALLVADLVFHAAMKNFDYGVVISKDSDFAVALKRVEDFGCRTGLVSLADRPPQRLIDACDDFQFWDASQLQRQGLAKHA